jgi:hypothetical protein
MNASPAMMTVAVRSVRNPRMGSQPVFETAALLH